LTSHGVVKPISNPHNATFKSPNLTPLLQSRFPIKTAIALVLVSGLAYYFLEIRDPDWTDDVYASYSGEEYGDHVAPLHFYANPEELYHWLDHHVPDPSAPLRNPAIVQFFSEQFEKLCHGWMMTPEDAAEGVEGMEKVQMPITHGCRFRSNTPCEDFYAVGTSPGVGGRLWNFWAVYDGHAGAQTALQLQWALIPQVSSALVGLGKGAGSLAVEESIKKAFLALDKTIMDRAMTAAKWFPPASAPAVAALTPAFSGSCALLASFDPDSDTLRVACTGDSRAVLGRWDPSSQSYTCMPLSVDQTGFNPAEVSRLAAAHPDEPSLIDPATGRMLGIAITRAFGDHRWKWDTSLISLVRDKFWGPSARPNTISPPYMTAEPEITETKINRSHNASESDFLILASDGLWDRISSDHAVECVQQYLAARTRGNGSVKNDPVLRANPPVFAPQTGLEPGVTCDAETGEGVDWQATPEYFAIEDENAAVCLARNAMGGTRRGLFMGLLSLVGPRARSAVDDTTILVVFFDRLGEGQHQPAKEVGETKKKSWWWPL
jgi:pyruvate dehydrogenase phosphatase